jgi:transposase
MRRGSPALRPQHYRLGKRRACRASAGDVPNKVAQMRPHLDAARLIGYVPQGHWKTVTFVAGLRNNKMVAPFVVDGPMTRANFLAYIEQCLRPTLKRGDIVIIGNLSAHKGDAVQQAIKTARANLLCLPKYSSDLNPIEQAFSKLKALLRKAAERTVPGLCRRIGKLLGAFSAKECQNYFANSGYASINQSINSSTLFS